MNLDANLQRVVTRYEELQHMLHAAGVKFTVNKRLVRGLDYYNATVFEWVTTQLGAQGTSPLTLGSAETL